MTISDEERNEIEADVAVKVAADRSTLHETFIFRHDENEGEALLIACDALVQRGCKIVSVASFPVPIVDEDGRRMGMMREILFRTV